MAGNDEAITKADLQELKVYIDGRLTNLESSVREVKTEVLVNAVKIENVRDNAKLSFSSFAIVVVIAVLAITFTFIRLIQEAFRSNQYLTRDEVREVIREELKLRENLRQ